MYRLIYISGESWPMTQADLREILKKAREVNAGLGITGLLLYKHGNFLQVLEGDQQVVETLFETIREDPRHRRVIAIIQEPAEDRDFPDWSMAYSEVGLRELPRGVGDLMQIPWDKLDLERYSTAVRKCLKAFMAATS